ncbi:MAG: branched-chain amino acid ABC transporter permease [Rhodobacteraceae bacterium]|nr:branched-chain amino acid ABC transporter permease [Paracoccaceae bacterium]
MAQSETVSATDATKARKSELGRKLATVPANVWFVAIILLLVPTFTGDFVQYQVFGWSFVLGLISLSLMFLAGYGGMVSLVQMTVAAVAGYCVAIFGTSGVAEISMGWPWYLSVIAAILIATLFCVATGALAVRTEGIYTIMITLAIASAFFYFTRQNYTIFNGFTGFNGVLPPHLFGIDWRSPTAFYYLSLFWAAAGYFAVVYVSRTPFGLALQGVRDNPRRMAALGYSVNAHRIAAYAFAGVLAAVGGILLTWSNGQISPGTAAVGPVIDILVIAVIGGINTPIGPFIGALIYVVLRTYALDFLVALNLSGERFKLLVGLGFLIIVYWSPDGVCGLWNKFAPKLRLKRKENASTEGKTDV